MDPNASKQQHAGKESEIWFDLQWNVRKWNVLQCVDDGPNWSHQPNAGEESGLAATVATGQYMGSIWKSQYMWKVYGKLYGKIMGKYMEKYIEKWMMVPIGHTSLMPVRRVV